MLHSKTEECALPILAALREKRTDFLNSYEESIMFFHFIAHQYFRTEPGRDDLTPENSSSGKTWESSRVKWWSSLHNLFQFGWQFSA